ncbi:MAG: putative transport system, permease component [Cyanobacteria bacterium RYN_339]|nr:putative transport system, permease component [Cyanobacteria bacterium RYN_339]
MKIGAIALNTWRETLRDRLLVAVLLCLAGMIGLVFAAEANVRDAGAGILDLCFTLGGGLGTLVAVFLGTSLVHKELDRRTIYIVLSKPITRFQFLAGKYLGLMATLGAVVAIISAGIGIVMLLVGRFDVHVFALCLALWVQLALLTAIAFCFSTITNAALSALYTVGLYIVGQNVLLIREFADSEVRLSKLNYYVGHGLYYLLPHFEPFDYKNILLYGHQLPWQAWGWGLAYGLVISLGYLLVATVAWEGRELP